MSPTSTAGLLIPSHGNERIAELESERHNSRAMKVLKENTLDFARRSTSDRAKVPIMKRVPHLLQHR
jgi:hypothetical protein